MKETQDIQKSYIAISVLNALLCLTAILLNSATLHALRKTSALPRNLRILLLSLVVSDLGVGLLVHPLQIAFLIVRLKHLPENGYTFKAAEIAYLLATNFLGYASVFGPVFGVITLGVDRFLAVHLHLRYQELVTRRRVVTLVVFVWMFCAIISLMRLWIDVNIMYIMFVIVEASWFVCATLLYYKIYVTARHHMKQIQMQQVQQMERGNEVENAAVITKSSVGILFVILALLVCYLPNFCCLVLHLILGKTTTIETMQLYTVTLTFLNSSLNPVIYCWKMRHIRQAVMGILRR
ncbi:uncharacterized protein [Porites lutea]|uniref:uncharacterized protein n=1 Tax=Porites lutea TaxID=51062 RepID=UPI003CC6C0ED